MASLSLATPASERSSPSTAVAQPTLLVAHFGDDVAAGYIASVAGCRTQVVDLSRTSIVDGFDLSDCVLFLKPRLTRQDLERLDAFLRRAADAKFIGVVSSFRAHLGDQVVAQTEARILERLQRCSGRVVIFRPGHILHDRSPAKRLFRHFGFAYPLVPRRLRTCFIDSGELFTAIERERREVRQRRRVVTLLGSNRAIKDVMREHVTGWFGVCLSVVCFVLALLQLGQIAALILDLFPSFRCWNVATLRPRSFAELLALCNRHNIQHVKVVGYNNGVVHFGHRYPGKTIVSTIHCNRLRRVDGAILKADCGATIRQAMDFLAGAALELPVIPNYSYVCLGTAFYVPIHGSASDVTSVAETLTRVLLFDPVQERMILAECDEPAFRDAVYDLSSRLIVLRLWLRVKPKARYFAQHQRHDHATSALLLEALGDVAASNVEIRKARGNDAHVTISKYYSAPENAAADVVEVPRDKLGRLWDRLEENSITSFLMHAFARTMIWHVELFFTAEEFEVFWRTHPALPIRKIQLRRMRRDGLPHSPFCEHDCVSVDLFLFRWNRAAFEKYLRQTFAVIRSNPGKHSQ